MLESMVVHAWFVFNVPHQMRMNAFVNESVGKTKPVYSKSRDCQILLELTRELLFE